MRKENKRKNRENVKKNEFIYRTNSSSSWTNPKRSRSNIKDTGKLEKKYKVVSFCMLTTSSGLILSNYY